MTAEEYLKEQKAHHNIPKDFYEWELIDILEGFGNIMYNEAIEDAYDVEVKFSSNVGIVHTMGMVEAYRESIIKLKK